jgi:hypothetical protein
MYKIKTTYVRGLYYHLLTISLLIWLVPSCIPAETKSFTATRYVMWSTGTRQAAEATQRSISATAEAIHVRGQEAEAAVVSVQKTADASVLSARRTAEVYRSIQEATQQANQVRTAEARALVLKQTQAEAERQQQQTQAAFSAAMELTREAQRTATERAWIMTGWTATADVAKSTATAQYNQTQSAGSIQQTATQSSILTGIQSARMTATMAAITNNVDQEGYTAHAWAGLKLVIPAILTVVLPTLLMILGAYALVSYIRARRNTWSAVYPAPNGDKPIIQLNGRLVDMDRAHQPVVDPANPVDLPVEDQLRLVAGDQRVDLTRALPRMVQVPGENAQAAFGGFQVLSPGDMPPANLLPNPDVGRVLDAQWTEAENEQ